MLANGRPELLYAASSLPEAARARLDAEQGRQAPATLPLFSPHLSLVSPRVPARASARPVPTSRAGQSEQRLRLLSPILDFRRLGPLAGSVLLLPDGQPVRTLANFIRYQALQTGTSESTLWRCLRQYDAGGAGELVRRKRSDAQQSRYFADPLHHGAAILVASLYLGDGFTPGLSMQGCFDGLMAQVDLAGLAKDDLPTYKTVCRFLRSAPEHLRILAREGRKAYGEKVLPYLRRGYTEHANQIWVSDHMIADVEVANDCFFEQPLGTPIRMRLTCVLDYRSRFVVGYSWAWEGSSASIATAVRRAVTAHGPAEHWYCDNGKDYLKVAKGATPGYLRETGPEGWVDDELDRIDRQTGILARLGMRVTHCIPHHPQSKHVERFFRTVHARFCSLWQTYTSGKPGTRPDATTALMEIHRKALRRGELERSMHPLATDFMAAFRVWLDEYHDAGDDEREGMQGRSPAEVFAAERNPHQRPAPAPTDLACLLAEHTSRKVDSCAVTINRVRYVPADAPSSHRMLERNGQKVTVAYDPIDPAHVVVLDDHLRPVTVLEAETLVRFAPEDPETQRQIATSMQQRGALMRSSREQLQQLTRARRRMGVRTPVELLAEKAAIDITDDTVTQRSPKLRHIHRQVTAPKYAHEIAAAILLEE